MKRHLLLILLLAATSLSLAQQPVLDWVANSGDIGFDIGRAVAIDGQGYSYVTGFFQTSVDFDPGPGAAQLSSNGDNDVMILKFAPTGSLVWARAIGGAGTDEGKGVAVDAAGNVYVTGRFANTVDFNPGSGTALSTSNGNSDAFFLKLDPNGNYLWHGIVGGTMNDEGLSIQVDASGFYAVGYYLGTVDLDPTAGSDPSSSNNGSLDFFVLRMGPTGTYRWGHGIGGTGFDYAYALALGSGSHAYVTGSFQSTVDFDPGIATTNGVATGIASAYVLKLDSLGTFQWVRQIGVTDMCAAYTMEIGPQGQVYVGGGYSGVIDFDPSPAVYSDTSNAYDIWVEKLLPNGNFAWVKTMGGLGDDYAYGLAITPGGGLYLTGGYGATVDFDPGPANYDLTSVGNSFDSYIERLDTNGQFVWVRGLGGGGIDYGFGLAAGNDDRVLTTGCWDQVVDFDTEAGTLNDTTNGNADIFVHMLKQCLPSAGSLAFDFCDSITLNGQTFTQAGTYVQHILNSGGCDSTLTLTLGFATSSSYTFSTTTCDTFWFNGYAYPQSGNYILTLVNQAGCDSVITFSLTIDTVSAAVQVSGGTLTASGGITYQWLDCNNSLAPVPGATSPSFTPATSGSYAVVAQGANCADTSACETVVGIAPTLASQVHLWPLPAQEGLHLDIPVAWGTCEVLVLDLHGRQLATKACSAQAWLPLPYPAGMYLIHVRSPQGSVVRTIVKD